MVYTSIDIRKIKFIAYIYIPFSQNPNEKSYRSAKIQAVKHLRAVFLLTAEQRRRPTRLKKDMFILTSLTSFGSMLLLKYNSITFQWFTIGLFSKYTKNVNILTPWEIIVAWAVNLNSLVEKFVAFLILIT